MKAPQIQAQSTRFLLYGIWCHLSIRRRIQLGLLLILVIFSAGAELASLGLSLPFLAALSAPEHLLRQPIIKPVMQSLGLTALDQIVLPTAALFAIAVVLSSLVRLANLRINGQLAASIGSELSCEAYRRTLYRPYCVHLERNSSTVITAVTSYSAGSVIAFSALLDLVAAMVVSVGLYVGLLLMDWSIALISAGVFGAVYVFLGITARRELLQNSSRIAVAAQRQVKVLQEGLGAIRDVLMDRCQPTYLGIYRAVDHPMRQLQVKNEFLGLFPRYAVEAVGMVLIAVLGALLVLQRGSGTMVIPLLGGLALGAQRLLPPLQQIYFCWAQLNRRNADLAGLLSMLEQEIPVEVLITQPWQFNHSICLEDVSFSYGLDRPQVLHGLDLKIDRGTRIGIVGSTGSGKSTLVDIMMGLLIPSKGKLLVDGFNIFDQEHPDWLPKWQLAIAHVPQNIYLADGSIAENIAFGIPKSDIDFQRVRSAAEQAQIANFIESSPDGYATFVGERGIRLSGGQRQRIGIARALYKQAQILVFDEATSALDGVTEAALIQSINELSPQLTIIMIAHRLSTLQNCDRIIEIKNRAVVETFPNDLNFSNSVVF